MVVESHPKAPRRRCIRLAAVVATLAIVSSAFAAAGGASAPERRAQGAGTAGEITYGLENETDTANGYCLVRSQLAISGIQVVAAVYDTLMVPNSKGEFVPYLAKSVEPNDDFTEWTITLREGVTFHDDTPLDAAAVKLNLDTYSGQPGAPQSAPLFSSFLKPLVVSNEIVDPLTVKVTLTQPVPGYPTYLYGVGRAGMLAPAQLRAGDACATNMIGTGPFMCAPGCWTPGESTVLDANPKYWQKGYPKASKITFKPVPNSAQRLNGLRGGELDVMHLDSAQSIISLEKDKKFNTLIQKPGLREIRYYFVNSGEAPFDNPDARLALAYAIDREEINQISNKGVFQLADGIMDSQSPGYLKDAGIPKHNLKKAKALVEDVKAVNGGSFDVTLLADTSDPENVREAEIIQGQLEAAGMTVTLPPQAAQASFINDAIAGNFGVFLWRNLHGGSTTLIDTDLYPWFAKTSLVNFGHIDDPELQAALEEMRLATDINERDTINQKINTIISENVYILPMWYVSWTIGSSKDVKVTLPKLPDGGGKPLFVYGRIPVLGLEKK